jgi:hypothetical protein
MIRIVLGDENRGVETGRGLDKLPGSDDATSTKHRAVTQRHHHGNKTVEAIPLQSAAAATMASGDARDAAAASTNGESCTPSYHALHALSNSFEIGRAHV